jgi:N-acetylmuramoyl-L-alanine amidase
MMSCGSEIVSSSFGPDSRQSCCGKIYTYGVDSLMKTLRNNFRATTIVMILVCWGGLVEADLPPELHFDPTAPKQNIEVTFADADRKGMTVTGRLLCGGSGVAYLAMADVASILNGGRFWREETMQLRLSLDGHDVVLTHDSRLILADGREVLLPTPAYALDGDIWAPVTLFERVLTPLSGEVSAWTPATSTLQVGGVRPNVLGSRLRSSGRNTTLTFECSESLRWRLERPASDKVRLTIFGGVLDQGRVSNIKARGLVEGLRVHQQDDRAVIDVSVLPLTSGARTYAEHDGLSIVLALTEAASGLPTPQVRGAVTMAEPDAFTEPAPVIDLIVLDPGHGGDDEGVVGPNGREEKDLMLKLARDLKDELKDAGFSVIMTRDGDDHRTSDDRAEKANLAGGDLFLSLHAGAWFDAERSGASAWTMSSGKADHNTEFSLWNAAQQGHLVESAALAESVLSRLSVDMGLQVIETGQVNTTVLQSIDMPAVMIEVGLLTHPGDRDLLVESKERRRLARSLAASVVAYRRSIDQRYPQEQGGRP